MFSFNCKTIITTIAVGMKEKKNKTSFMKNPNEIKLLRKRKNESEKVMKITSTYSRESAVYRCSNSPKKILSVFAMSRAKQT